MDKINTCIIYLSRVSNQNQMNELKFECCAYHNPWADPIAIVILRGQSRRQSAESEPWR